MCDVWSIRECVKKAWFDTDGNFSDAQGVNIGENFASNLYLARVGPGPWEGITIGNFSQVSLKPAVEIRPRDNTTSYFAELKESDVGLNLDMNVSTEKTFYMITFDNRPDGLQNLTDLMVDDDLNLTEPWWRSGTEGNYTYYDFYTNESGAMAEQWGNPPSAIWSGYARFGEINESIPWENRPEWEIVTYNQTDMLFRKHIWEINKAQNITLLVRSYNFDQTPISGATVTVQSIIRFSPIGFNILQEDTDYLVENIQNVTDSYGYGILKLVPIAWDTGDYMVTMQVNETGNIETTSNWFRIV